MNVPATIPHRLPMPKIEGMDDRTWQVLTQVIFPNAKTSQAIVMAVDYCRVRHLDIMKRPVHIVPMWNSTLGREVETIWPGISEIQTTAARTKAWAGMDPPQWGEDQTEIFKGRKKVFLEKGSRFQWQEDEKEVTFPESCAVTVYRMIEGQRCAFTEPVYWLEAYSRSGGKDSELPTDMWLKRPRGQLHKVAKAASLRAAFPEETDYSAEEMAGKEIEAGGVVIDAELPPEEVWEGNEAEKLANAVKAGNETMRKSQARPLYTELAAEVENSLSEEKLKIWMLDNRQRIGLLPPDWQQHLRLACKQKLLWFEGAEERGAAQAVAGTFEKDKPVERPHVPNIIRIEDLANFGDPKTWKAIPELEQSGILDITPQAAALSPAIQKEIIETNNDLWGIGDLEGLDEAKARAEQRLKRCGNLAKLVAGVLIEDRKQQIIESER